MKEQMEAFSDSNADFINRVGFVDSLVQNGIVEVDQNGEYQMK